MKGRPERLSHIFLQPKSARYLVVLRTLNPRRNPSVYAWKSSLRARLDIEAPFKPSRKPSTTTAARICPSMFSGTVMSISCATPSGATTVLVMTVRGSREVEKAESVCFTFRACAAGSHRSTRLTTVRKLWPVAIVPSAHEPGMPALELLDTNIDALLATLTLAEPSIESAALVWKSENTVEAPCPSLEMMHDLIDCIDGEGWQRLTVSRDGEDQTFAQATGKPFRMVIDIAGADWSIMLAGRPGAAGTPVVTTFKVNGDQWDVHEGELLTVEDAHKIFEAWHGAGQLHPDYEWSPISY
jgi:hypothetical protein